MVPFGGDFAGRSASFDAATGELIPIPEHYVPDSLLEWGQAPLLWEVLVSEDDTVVENSVDDDDAILLLRQQNWRRQTTTILPATGCGVDNLETMKRIDRAVAWCEDSLWRSRRAVPEDGGTTLPQIVSTITQRCSNHAGGGGSQNTSNGLFRVEACFGWNHQIDDDDDDDDSNRYRSRVSVDLRLPSDDPSQQQQLQPITQLHVALERQISPNSSHGTVADGGGLDGQRVSRWLGPVLSSRRAVESLFGGRLEAPAKHQWKPAAADSEQSFWVGRGRRTQHDDDDTVISLVLPGNVTVAYSYYNCSSSSEEDIGDDDEPHATAAPPPIQRLLHLEIGQVYPDAGLRQVLGRSFRFDKGSVVADRVQARLEQGEWMVVD